MRLNKCFEFETFFNVGRNFGRQRIFVVFTKKNTQLSELFIEKGFAVSAVTMDNAKMLSQLMPKSRSLAINEKKLQPLLV